MQGKVTAEYLWSLPLHQCEANEALEAISRSETGTTLVTLALVTSGFGATGHAGSHYGRHADAHDRQHPCQFPAHNRHRCQQKFLATLVRLGQDGMAMVEGIE